MSNAIYDFAYMKAATGQISDIGTDITYFIDIGYAATQFQHGHRHRLVLFLGLRHWPYRRDALNEEKVSPKKYSTDIYKRSNTL